MIKDYTIWLENSECIIGQAERENILELMKMHNKKCKNVITFSDEKGILSINMKKVIAISMERVTENGKAGF
jgi:hypothetical protein